MACSRAALGVAKIQRDAEVSKKVLLFVDQIIIRADVFMPDLAFVNESKAWGESNNRVRKERIVPRLKYTVPLRIDFNPILEISLCHEWLDDQEKFICFVSSK